MAKSKGGPKVYAVARGRVPGIYATWGECQAQTKGFSGAIFKSFKANHEAQAFVQLNNSSSSTSTKSTTAASAASRKRPPTENDNDSRSSSQRKKTTSNRQTRKILSSSMNNSNDKFQMQIIIHFDGGSRGNPGVAGAGAQVIVVIANNNNTNSSQSAKQATAATATTTATTTYSVREFCGNRETNNYAEYHGLIAGLKQAKSCILEQHSNKSPKKPLFQLQVYGDSNLIIQQLKGAWQCRHANLIPLFLQCKELIDGMKDLDNGKKSEVLLEHVYREQNKAADTLANEAMDERRSWTTSTSDRSIADSPNDNKKSAETTKSDDPIIAATSEQEEAIDVIDSDDDDKGSKSNFQLQIKIHFDGGSRGNPGVAGAGAQIVVVAENNSSTESTTTQATTTTTIYSVRKFCGHWETNNVAEYNGLVAGLERAKSCIEQYQCSKQPASSSASQSPKKPAFQLHVYGDSKLIIQQLKGVWKCDHPNMKPLFLQCQKLIGEMKNLDVSSELWLAHVYREQNKAADALANEAMDQRRSWTTSTSIVDGPSGKKSAAAVVETIDNENGGKSEKEVIDVDADDDSGSSSRLSC